MEAYWREAMKVYQKAGDDRAYKTNSRKELRNDFFFIDREVFCLRCRENQIHEEKGKKDRWRSVSINMVRMWTLA